MAEKRLNLFAIDTSSKNISFSILWKEKFINYNSKKISASDILIYIEKYIKKFSISLKDIDCFIVGKGPGSFMGLRISFSIIKAFSISLNKPIISIGSFFSIAYPFIKKYKKIAVLTDAKRNLIYGATFYSDGKNLILKEKEKLYNIFDFISKREDYFFITYDEHIKEEALKLSLNLNFCSKMVFPKANYLLKMALPYYLKKRFIPLENLKPLYIYPKTCQIKNV
mgnify:CR=1 FL=1